MLDEVVVDDKVSAPRKRGSEGWRRPKALIDNAIAVEGDENTPSFSSSGLSDNQPLLSIPIFLGNG